MKNYAPKLFNVALTYSLTLKLQNWLRKYICGHPQICRQMKMVSLPTGQHDIIFNRLACRNRDTLFIFAHHVTRFGPITTV